MSLQMSTAKALHVQGIPVDHPMGHLMVGGATDVKSRYIVIQERHISIEHMKEYAT